MTRKEKIAAYIQSEYYVPLNIKELSTVLDVPKEDTEELTQLLNSLIDDGRIFLTKKGRYMPVDKNAKIAAGRLQCNANGFFGFLICDDEDQEDIFIHGNNMGNALHGDRVLVKIDDEHSERGRREGHILRVTERANKNIVGTIYKIKNSIYRLRPDDRRIYKNVRINPENMAGADIGDRVSVEITEITKAFKLHGRVVARLGRSDSLKSMIEGIILNEDIKQEFDSVTIAAAEKAPSEVMQKDILGRADYRDKLIFTIDGDNARDFDDAVSLERAENGNYILGVHIADVTHYVKEDSPLDIEAYMRGTSVYLADRVIPMLPEALSNGICSLNPMVDRLALSVMMEIDESGNVAAHELTKSVIRSRERMTYTNATKIIEGEDEHLIERYSHIAPTLIEMAKLSEILTRKRIERGAIDFDFPETEIQVDSDGTPIDIGRAERGVSNRLIESFMLCANETIAEYAYWSELPFVYRVHEAPTADKLSAFNSFVRPFNLQIKGRIDNDEPIHPKAMQTVLDSVKGRAEERMVSLEMLHSLMKAEYRSQNIGHFGLAAKYYCHFTSPIRRYPDLMIHRILKEFIDGKLVDDRLRHYRAIVSESAAHSSERETAAEYAERNTDDLMKTAYMSNYVGEVFKATVANVTGFGMFIELTNTVEGLIRVESMNDDYYEYDEKASVLRGRYGGIEYKTGTPVEAVLVRADVETRRIDFVLEKDMYPGIFRAYKEYNSRLKREKAAKGKKNGRYGAKYGKRH